MPDFTVAAENPGPLIEYLRALGLIAADELPTIEELAGGVSSSVVLVRRAGASDLVVKQALEKLRVAVEWHCDPGRILREAEGMQVLAQVCPPGTIVPLLHTDPVRHLIVMAAIPEPHRRWKDLLFSGEIRSRHIEQAADLLAAIHRGYWLKPQALPQDLMDRSYFESLRLEPFYSYAAETVPQAKPFLAELIQDTRKSSVALVHGDYSPKNILIAAEQMVLLDHEVIHFGDPAFDIGFLMAHLLSKAHCVPSHRGDLIAAALGFIERYSAALGPVEEKSEAQARAARHTLGCLLARVAGRSPLEYLGPEQRARQRDIVLSLMAPRVQELPELISEFSERLHAENRRA